MVRSRATDRGSSRAPSPAQTLAAWSWRFACCFAFWLVLATRGGLALPDILAGAIAAGVGAWTSLALIPPVATRVGAVATVRFAIRTAGASVVAGVDVAIRALDPRRSVKPGFVSHRSMLRPGLERESFVAVTALLPGTLPVARLGDDVVQYHCLDSEAPVERSIAADERSFVALLRDSVAVVTDVRRRPPAEEPPPC
ncbi:MAG: Na+/H+ antiporter subunit E [Phycisphaerales bacterium]|nr:Na+/H+ antiporter subunit E [Phycisphaerales bacterium]